MFTFFAAVFFLIITPGPGVLSTAGIGAAYGFRPGFRYIFGLFLGNNLVAVMVISGVAAALLIYPVIRVVLFAASTGYLLYLAARIAFAGSKIAFIHSESPPGVLGGLMLQIINPKAYVVNTTLFAGFPFMPENLAAETLIKFAIANAVWIPVHFGWLGAGVILHRLDLAPGTQRLINFSMAAAMLLVVGLAAAAQMRG